MPSEPRPSGLVPPVLGRPSPASLRSGALRGAADSSSATYRADGGDGGGWSVRAASVAGARHRLAGRGPEDAYAWRLLAPPADGAGSGVATVILAVADGVGSVEGAAAASQAAAVAACDAMAAALAAASPGSGGSGEGGDDGWGAAFRAADTAVRAAGGATTLLLAVIGGDRRGAVGRLGDSAAFLLESGQWTELGPADGPDDCHVSTATAALPAADGSAPAIEVTGVRLDRGGALVMLTDGIANPLRDGPTTVAPAVAGTLAEPPRPLELALLADFSRQGCLDDRTVVGLWPQPTDWIEPDP